MAILWGTIHHLSEKEICGKLIVLRMKQLRPLYLYLIENFTGKIMIRKFKDKLWRWPDGLLWIITNKYTLRSRSAKFGYFMSVMRPKSVETILDVGVNPFFGRGTNFIELWYPNPEKIIALTNEDSAKFKNFLRHFPKTKLVIGDGKNLAFRDNSFDIVFSNAVIEHVGVESEQKQFIEELVRVGKRILFTTPNYWFPIDSHTLLPFVHWLPDKIKFWIYRVLGIGYYANKNNLNLLSARRFLSLFPKGVQVSIWRQKSFGITTSLIATVVKDRYFYRDYN